MRFVYLSYIIFNKYMVARAAGEAAGEATSARSNANGMINTMWYGGKQTEAETRQRMMRAQHLYIASQASN